jgi:hypothetical protein
MIGSEDIAYIAGLFDGEGSIHIKRGIESKKKHDGKPGRRISNSMRISMEITMTDQSVLRWLHEVLGVGTLNKKPRKGRRKDGTKYYVCRLLWPYAHTKLPKIQQVIEHYAKDVLMNGKVVNLEEYKKAMSLE